MALGKLSVVLDANIAKFESDMGRAARVAQQQSAAMQRAVENAATRIATVLGGALAAGKMVEFTKAAIDLADNLNDMAQKVGVSASALSVLKVSADANGASLDTLNTGMNAFARSVGAAAYSATSQQAAAFKAMGIAITDANGHLRPMQDLFQQTTLKLAGYRDGVSKTALVQQVFGKSGADMIPMLNELGTEGFDAATKHAKELGGYISDDAAAAAGKFNDQVDALKTALGGLAITVSQELLPTLQATVDKLVDFIKTAREDGTIKKFADSIGFVLDHLQALAAFVIGRAVFVRIAAGIATVTTAANGAAAAVGILRGALAVLGGPVGILATAFGLLAGWYVQSSKGSTELAGSTDQLATALETLHGLSGQAQADARAEAIEQIKATLAVQARVKAEIDRYDAMSKLALQTPSVSIGPAGAMGGSVASVTVGVDAKRVENLRKQYEASRIAVSDMLKAIQEPIRNAAVGGTGKPDAPTLTTDTSGDAAAKIKALADAYNALAVAAQKATEKQLSPQDKLQADYTDNIRALAELAGKYVAAGGDAAKASQLFLAGKAGITKDYTAALAALTAQTKEYADNLQHQVDLQQNAIDIQVAAVGMGDKEAQRLKEVNDIKQRGAEAELRLRQEMAQHPDQTAAITAQIELQVEQTQKLVDVTVNGYAKMDAARASAANGLHAAVQNYIDQASDIAGQTASLFGSAFDGMTDALTNFVMTGKLSFKDLANSIIADLIRMEARILISQALMSIFGSSGTSIAAGYMAGGGASYAASGVNWGVGALGGARANGGPVSSGTTYLVGERGPELFTPHTAGAITSNAALRAGGGVTVIVENHTDSQAKVSQSKDSNGGDILTVFIGAAVNEVNKQIGRGGSTAQVLQQTFGLQRRGVAMAG